MPNKTILLVDADLITYRHCAAAETRSIIAKHLSSGSEREFKNRTEFFDYLCRIEYQYDPEKFLITDVQQPEELEFALSTIKKNMKKMEEFCWADDVEVYLGGGQTFRHKLPLPTPYKAGRSDLLKPFHLDSAREFMQKSYSAKIVREIETDDIVTIRAYEELAKGNSAIIATVDKDQYQCQGVHILNWMQEEWKLELIPDVGHLRKEKNSIKGNGLMFLAFQVLAGDSADTYKGYQLSQVSYGPTAAMKALQNCKTESEIMQVLEAEYQRLYPEAVSYVDCHGNLQQKDWRELLDLYWRCAYMLRFHGDESSRDEFMEKRGIKV